MFKLIGIVMFLYGFFGCVKSIFEKKDSVIVLDGIRYCIPALMGVFILMLQG